MAQIELPNSALPLVAGEPAAEADVAGTGRHHRASVIGVGATLAWFALVLGYIVHQTGARAFVALPAHELAMAAAGVAAPAILLWLVLLYLRRGEVFERHAKELEARLDALTFPAPGGDARMRSVAAGLERHAEIARTATERSIEALTTVVNAAAEAARESEITLGHRAELLRKTAEEANARSAESARQLDERARSLARASELIAYHHKDLETSLRRRGELAASMVGEAAERAREVGLAIRDQASLLMATVSLAEVRGREAGLALDAQAARLDGVLDDLDSRVSRMSELLSRDAERIEGTSRQVHERARAIEASIARRGARAVEVALGVAEAVRQVGDEFEARRSALSTAAEASVQDLDDAGDRLEVRAEALARLGVEAVDRLAQATGELGDHQAALAGAGAESVRQIEAANEALEGAMRIVGEEAATFAEREEALASDAQTHAEVLASAATMLGDRQLELGVTTDRIGPRIEGLADLLAGGEDRLRAIEAEMTRQGRVFDETADAAEARARTMGEVLARHREALAESAQASDTSAESLAASMAERLRSLDAMADAMTRKGNALAASVEAQRAALTASLDEATTRLEGMGERLAGDGARLLTAARNQAGEVEALGRALGDELDHIAEAGARAGAALASTTAKLDDGVEALDRAASVGTSGLQAAAHEFAEAEARLARLNEGLGALAALLERTDGLAETTESTLVEAVGRARAELEAFVREGAATRAHLYREGRESLGAAEAARAELARTATAMEAAMERGTRAVATAATALEAGGDQGAAAASKVAEDIERLGAAAEQGAIRLRDGARELDGRIQELQVETSGELTRLVEAGSELSQRQEQIAGLLATLIDRVEGAESRLDQRVEALIRKAGEAIAGASDLADQRAAMLETRLMALSATTDSLVSRLARHVDDLGELTARTLEVAEPTPEVGRPKALPAPETSGIAEDGVAAGDFLSSLAAIEKALNRLGLDLARLDLAEESAPESEGRFLSKLIRRPGGEEGARDRLAREYRENAAFRAQADAYLAAFEAYLALAGADDKGETTRSTMLGSDVGKLFHLLGRARDAMESVVRAV